MYWILINQGYESAWIIHVKAWFTVFYHSLYCLMGWIGMNRRCFLNLMRDSVVILIFVPLLRIFPLCPYFSYLELMGSHQILVTTWTCLSVQQTPSQRLAIPPSRCYQHQNNHLWVPLRWRHCPQSHLLHHSVHPSRYLFPYISRPTPVSESLTHTTTMMFLFFLKHFYVALPNRVKSPCKTKSMGYVKVSNIAGAAYPLTSAGGSVPAQ